MSRRSNQQIRLFREVTGPHTAMSHLVPGTVWDKPKLIIENECIGPDVGETSVGTRAMMYLFVSYSARRTRDGHRSRVGRNGVLSVEGSSVDEVNHRLLKLCGLSYVSLFKELPPQNLKIPWNVPRVLQGCLCRHFDWLNRDNFGEQATRW